MRAASSSFEREFEALYCWKMKIAYGVAKVTTSIPRSPPSGLLGPGPYLPMMPVEGDG